MKTIWKSVLIVGFAALFTACGSDDEEPYLERMSEEHKDDSPVENAASDLGQNSQPTGEEVAYAKINGNEITGYLARPKDADANTPALVVIHEWWGLNDNIRMMTDKLAGKGYTALAVDLYRGKVAESPDSAKKYSGAVEEEKAIENLTQAYNYLSEQKSAENIGTIGWCFGGGWSLQTALAHPNKIDATVIYYGRLVTDPGQLEKLQMPVLGIFGAEDESIPPKQVKKFESALDEVGVTHSIHIYENAGHAFANPSGTRYAEEAADDAWQKTVNFLDEHLK